MAKPASISQLCAIALIAFAGYGIPAAAASATKPNIILLISDDHRWDGLGIAGNSNIETPNLDRMAREGQWYSEATIQMPLCAPSRAVMLTGLTPSESGYYSNNRQRTDLQRPNGFDQYAILPKEMRQAGYHTAFAGKWHLRPNPWLCGFETVKHWMLGGMGPYRNPKLANGKSRNVQQVEGFTQTIFTEDALDVIKSKADGKTTRPLFLWLAFTASHSPFVPNPEPFSGMYDGKTANDLAPGTYYFDPGDVKGGDKTWQHYYEAISALDAEVGRIMDTVRNSSLSTNTVVVFIGDNGFMMGARDQWGKGGPYEDSLRVPMIVWGPDSIMKAKGTTVTAAANSIDLPPTFVKMAGATPPAEWVGRDLTNVIRDGKPHEISWAVAQNPNSDGKLTKAYRVIRTPEYKLITWEPDTGKDPELYDLVKDPGEKINLYGKPEVTEVQARLEKQLKEFRAKAGDNQWELKGETSSQKTFKNSDNNEPQKKADGKRKRKRNRRAKDGGKRGKNRQLQTRQQ